MDSGSSRDYQRVVIQLRPFQADGVEAIRSAWDAGANNVLYTLPTGGGKTTVFDHIIAQHDAPAVAIAHRQELVSQISLGLARFGVRHRIIAPDALIKYIVRLHVEETGANYHDQYAWHGVAGVDTLIRRGSDPIVTQWARTVTLWVQDEAHHVLAGNKWGKAAAIFPDARGLGVTATPVRADGRGLGSHADGLMDQLIVGPSMRDLINAGYLTDYRVVCPPSDVQIDDVPLSASGDFSPPKLAAAVHKSHIVGDVVANYLKFAAGKRGITFAVDLDHAGQMASAYSAAGVRAEIVHAGTPDRVRVELVRRLARHDLDQLVNVDIFGEGFDLPTLDVVSMARPTESFSLFAQQFGRAVRPIYADGMPLGTAEQRSAAIAASSKPAALIIDHVGNITRHGLPDAPRTWSLDRRERRSGTRSDVIPVRVCPECIAAYERIYKACPYCGHVAEPAARSGPQHVDGDLFELDAETLARMRGEVATIGGPARIPQHLDGLAAAGLRKQHRRRQEAQDVLRDAIAWWAGYQRAAGRSDSESYRRFYFQFGVDVLTAQALGRPEAEALTAKVWAACA